MLQPRRKTEELPAHEELLLDYAQRLRRHVAGRRAIHLHLSQLQRQNRRPQHLRAASSTFDRLVADHEGQCYVLSDGDIVVVVKNAKVASIDECVLRTRYLFKEDPLARDEAESEDGKGVVEAEFCTWYDLEQDYDAFLRLAVSAEQTYRTVKHRLETTTRPPPLRWDAPTTPLDPSGLGRLEELVATADLSVMLKRQTVCVMKPGTLPAPIFSEFYVSIDELRRRVMPDVDIAGTPWLFHHLMPFLDRRVLRLVPERTTGGNALCAINIAIETVLAEDFLVFDRKLRATTPKPMILEFQAVDIMHDLAGYQFARDLARSRNYKICVDGLSHLGFPLLRRDELEADFVKLIWQPQLAGGIGPDRLRELRRAVHQTGEARVVLAHCENEQARRFGELIGISLFQGRHVDRLIGDAAGGR
jgi:hypothetical protein